MLRALFGLCVLYACDFVLWYCTVRCVVLCAVLWYAMVWCIALLGVAWLAYGVGAVLCNVVLCGVAVGG